MQGMSEGSCRSEGPICASSCTTCCWLQPVLCSAQADMCLSFAAGDGSAGGARQAALPTSRSATLLSAM